MRRPKFLLNGYQLSLALKPCLSLIIAGLLMVSLTGRAEDSAPTSTTSKPTTVKQSKHFFPGVPPEWPPILPQLPDSAFNTGCTQIWTPATIQAENTYKQALYKQLLTKWEFLAQYAGVKPVFSINVAKDGQIMETRLLKSSGVSDIDTRALDGLNQLVLPELPENYPLPTLQSIVSYNSILFYSNKTSIERDKIYQPADKIFQPWLNHVMKISRKHWSTPANERQNKQTVVLIILDPKTGQVFQRSILQTSCNPKMDQSALEAIDKISPLPPLPVESLPTTIPKDILTVRIGFHYRVWKY